MCKGCDDPMERARIALSILNNPDHFQRAALIDGVREAFGPGTPDEEIATQYMALLRRRLAS